MTDTGSILLLSRRIAFRLRVDGVTMNRAAIHAIHSGRHGTEGEAFAAAVRERVADETLVALALAIELLLREGT
jgi:hypothetical protein